MSAPKSPRSGNENAIDDVVIVDESEILPKNKWKSVTSCNLCSFKFNLMHRRHHCRFCGITVCIGCSSKGAKVSILANQLHRICQTCFRDQQARASKLIKEMEDNEDDEEGGALTLDLPELKKTKNSNMVRIARTAKLGKMLFPILTSYRTSINQIATMRKNITDDKAFMEAKIKALDAQHAKESPRFKHVLVVMGGLYNKGAQLLASQQMIMPARLVEELKTCFEDLPARPWPKMERAITHCLGKGNQKKGAEILLQEFKSINQVPLASASIGQVHTGALKTGEKVVVKVLYPEIRRNMYADLATIKSTLNMSFSMLGIEYMKNMIEVFYDELASNFPRELDFHIELCHMEFAKKILKRHSPEIVVPDAFPSLSGTTLLTQTMVSGVTLNKIGEEQTPAGLKAGRRALDMVIDAMGLMIFQDGFFHADPHPGNIMVCADGRPALIDWGQCMNLTRSQRRRLCQMVLLLRTRCMDLIVTGLNASGFDFPEGETSHTAGIIFLFFDSAIKSSFTEDIQDFGETLRSSPSQMALPRDVPREVIFFGRVMQCLRRDCEILDVDISAIDRWAPIARKALYTMVYEDPIPRNPAPAANGQLVEDDSSQFSPSRMVLMLDTSQFDTIKQIMLWAQMNPEVGDAALSWATAINQAGGTPGIAHSALKMAVRNKDAIETMLTSFVKAPGLVSMLLLLVVALWCFLAFKGLVSILLSDGS